MLVTSQFLWVLFGCIVGVLLGRFALSVRSVASFCRRILPALTALKSYSVILTDCLLKSEVHDQTLSKGKRTLERALLERYSPYPEGIYKVGFNPGLRAGLRFFLVHLECVVELYFAISSTIILHENLKLSESIALQEAMNSEEAQHFKNALGYLADPIVTCMRQNESLLSVLIVFCETHAVTEVSAKDYVSDVTDLEERLRQIIPQNLALLDLSPSSLRVASLVRDIKEVRQVLLQLLASLPRVS